MLEPCINRLEGRRAGEGQLEERDMSLSGVFHQFIQCSFFFFYCKGFKAVPSMRGISDCVCVPASFFTGIHSMCLPGVFG